jgi:hypothetical protein
MLDFFGHIGYFFLMIGQICITRKHIYGWIFRFCGELTWVIIGLIMGMTSIYIWGVAFMIIDVIGFFKWKREI